MAAGVAGPAGPTFLLGRRPVAERHLVTVGAPSTGQVPVLRPAADRRLRAAPAAPAGPGIVKPGSARLGPWPQTVRAVVEPTESARGRLPSRRRWLRRGARPGGQPADRGGAQPDPDTMPRRQPGHHEQPHPPRHRHIHHRRIIQPPVRMRHLLRAHPHTLIGDIQQHPATVQQMPRHRHRRLRRRKRRRVLHQLRQQMHHIIDRLPAHRDPRLHVQRSPAHTAQSPTPPPAAHPPAPPSQVHRRDTSCPANTSKFSLLRRIRVAR